MILPPPRSTLFPYTTLFRSLKVCSPGERISNILLKKRVLRRNIETSLLLNMQSELKLAYEDFGDISVMLDITSRSEEHTSELQSRRDLVCRLLLEKKKKNKK